jgi:hypothetical protein
MSEIFKDDKILNSTSKQGTKRAGLEPAPYGVPAFFPFIMIQAGYSLENIIVFSPFYVICLFLKMSLSHNKLQQINSPMLK